MTSPSQEPSDALAEAAAPPEPAQAATEVATEVAADAEGSGDEWLRDLPEEIVAWLVRSLPTRELWEWLGEDARGGLRLALLSGFRAVPANLKQLAVTKKLVKHTSTHPEVLSGLVELWRGGRAPLFEAITERDNDSLLEILPTLLHAHGGEALLLALAATGRHQALDALTSLEADESGTEPSASQAPSAVENQDAAPATEPDSAPSSAEESRLRALLEEVREREAKLQSSLRAALERVEKERDKVLLRAREADRTLKALQNRVEALEKERDESRKLLDRTERRGRHVERQKDELEADNKKLKRQMRRQQEISEDVRKQLARANSELEELRPASAAATPASTLSAAPPKPALQSTPRPDAVLDREYVLKADGRQVRVTARQVKERVDANDEEWVFRLIQALEAVSQVDPAGHRKFLDALKPLGFYYARVLTTDTLRVLVDASNVVRFEKDHLGKGRLKYLLAMREELRRRDCFPIKLVADASLPYFIDDPAELESMVRRGAVEMSVPGQEADEILAREARRTGAYVVTNDRLFFHKTTPDFEPPRITFRVIEGHLIVDDF